MSTTQKTIEELANREYKYGFYTDIEADTVPPGLSEDVIRHISAKKQEPAWLLDDALELPARYRAGARRSARGVIPRFGDGS